MDHLNALAMIAEGLDPEIVKTAAALGEEQRQMYGRSDCRLAFSLAKTAYEVSGQTSNNYLAFAALLREDSPVTDAHRKLASAVFTAMGRIAIEDKKSELEKEAFIRPWLETGKRIFQAGATAVPGAAKLLIGGGLLTGGLVGGTAFAAQRSIEGQDAKLRGLERQRDIYLRLATEVDEELARRGLAKTPENVAAAVDYLT